MVRYVHNGNPRLQADRIRFTIRQFADRAEVVSDDVIVTVHVVPPLGAIFAGEPRPLVVDPPSSDSPPLSDVIGPDVIQFRYNFSGGSVCTLRFDGAGRGRFGRQSLMSGGLVASDGATPVGNLSIDCRDFLVAGFRYRYSAGRPRTAVDYVPLTASVDGWVQASTVTESVFLPVRLVGGSPNSAPKFVRRSASYRSSSLVADQFAPTLLDAESLRARDDVTQSTDLLISVLSPPLPDFDDDDDDVQSRGYFVHRRAPWTPVASFWQRDVVDGSVAFRAPTHADAAAGARVDAVFTATDGHFVSSQRLRLSITVRPGRPAGPKVSITSSCIHPSSVDKSLQLLYDNDRTNLAIGGIAFFLFARWQQQYTIQCFGCGVDFQISPFPGTSEEYMPNDI